MLSFSLQYLLFSAQTIGYWLIEVIAFEILHYAQQGKQVLGISCSCCIHRTQSQEDIPGWHNSDSTSRYLCDPRLALMSQSLKGILILKNGDNQCLLQLL